jgi:predicted anti-sigma-YlaC factor YlaD
VTCQELVELVTAYLDGALDQETEHRLIEHLPECDGCSRYLDQIRRTIRSLNDFGSR